MGYTHPFLDVRKIAGGWSLTAPGATTDDLSLIAHAIDTIASVVIKGNGGVDIIMGGGSALSLYGSNQFLDINYSTPDVNFSGIIADKNLFLNPAGTGKVKFGTYTGGAATDSTGYITILDAAGNTRKLMVQA